MMRAILSFFLGVALTVFAASVVPVGGIVKLPTFHGPVWVWDESEMQEMASIVQRLFMENMAMKQYIMRRTSV